MHLQHRPGSEETVFFFLLFFFLHAFFRLLKSVESPKTPQR